MSQPRFGHRRVGFLAACQSFTEETDVLLLTTNLFKKEFLSHNPYDVGIALNGLANIVNADLARDLLPDVVNLISHSHPYIRKKALLSIYKLFIKYPQGLRLTFDRLKERLDDSEVPVISCAVNVICELAHANPRNYLAMAPKFFRLLTTCNNNWMLIKVVKLMGALVSEEPRLARKLLDPLATIVQHTAAKSLQYECIQTITLALPHTPRSDGSDAKNVSAIVSLCSEVLKGFVEENDQNLTYLGLVGFVSLMGSHPRAVVEHKELIIKCLLDDDITIRTRALELLSGMVTRRSLMDLIHKLLQHVSFAEGAYKEELITKIIFICSRDHYSFLTDFSWYVAVLVELGRTEGLKVEQAKIISKELMTVTLKREEVRIYSTEAMLGLILDEGLLIMRGKGARSEVLKAAAWIVSEYSSFIPHLIKDPSDDSSDSTSDRLPKEPVVITRNLLSYDDDDEDEFEGDEEKATDMSSTGNATTEQIEVLGGMVPGPGGTQTLSKYVNQKVYRDSLDHLLHPRSTSLPVHVQVVYMQAVLKLFLSSCQYCEDGELGEIIALISARLGTFLQSVHVEVQERASTFRYILASFGMLSLQSEEDKEREDMMAREEEEEDENRGSHDGNDDNEQQEKDKPSHQQPTESVNLLDLLFDTSDTSNTPSSSSNLGSGGGDSSDLLLLTGLDSNAIITPAPDSALAQAKLAAKKFTAFAVDSTSHPVELARKNARLLGLLVSDPFFPVSSRAQRKVEGPEGVDLSEPFNPSAWDLYTKKRNPQSHQQDGKGEEDGDDQPQSMLVDINAVSFTFEFDGGSSAGDMLESSPFTTTPWDDTPALVDDDEGDSFDEYTTSSDEADGGVRNEVEDMDAIFDGLSGITSSKKKKKKRRRKRGPDTAEDQSKRLGDGSRPEAGLFLLGGNTRKEDDMSSIPTIQLSVADLEGGSSDDEMGASVDRRRRKKKKKNSSKKKKKRSRNNRGGIGSSDEERVVGDEMKSNQELGDIDITTPLREDEILQTRTAYPAPQMYTATSSTSFNQQQEDGNEPIPNEEEQDGDEEDEDVEEVGIGSKNKKKKKSKKKKKKKNSSKQSSSKNQVDDYQEDLLGGEFIMEEENDQRNNIFWIPVDNDDSFYTFSFGYMSSLDGGHQLGLTISSSSNYSQNQQTLSQAHPPQIISIEGDSIQFSTSSNNNFNSTPNGSFVSFVPFSVVDVDSILNSSSRQERMIQVTLLITSQVSHIFGICCNKIIRICWGKRRR